MCAVSKPSSSIAASTASASTCSSISPTIGGPPACPARVEREDVVMALERRQDELPGAPDVDKAVDAHQRLPGPRRDVMR